MRYWLITDLGRPRVARKTDSDGDEMTNLVAANHGTSPLQSKKVRLILGPADCTTANMCAIQGQQSRSFSCCERGVRLEAIEAKLWMGFIHPSK